jgi:hypothetical protein
MMLADFEDDPDLYVLKLLKYIGIEVWQVNVFIPNILHAYIYIYIERERERARLACS